jgi:hypothetical protein
MRAPRIPGKRCGTRIVALMCASSPDPYAHRPAGQAHTRHRGSRPARPASRWQPRRSREPEPSSPPRGDTRRAAVAHLPMRSPGRRQALTFPPHRRRRRRPERKGGLQVPRRPLPPRTRASAWTLARRPQRTSFDRAGGLRRDARFARTEADVSARIRDASPVRLSVKTGPLSRPGVARTSTARSTTP